VICRSVHVTPHTRCNLLKLGQRDIFYRLLCVREVFRSVQPIGIRFFSAMARYQQLHKAQENTLSTVPLTENHALEQQAAAKFESLL
jgi:hypothetical protein